MLRSRVRLSLAVAVALAACGGSEERSARLTVMTRNLYLGAPLDPLIGAIATQASPATLAQLADQAWAAVQATKFPERAKSLAAEVAAQAPDVLALQEVALWRTGATPAPATVAIDFMALLQAELQARGLRYATASTVENFDGSLPLTNGTFVRYTDHDAILVRDGVAFSEPKGANYAAQVPLLQNLTIKRGWVSVRIDLGFGRVRVFSTHLEVDQPPDLALFQAEQARELSQLLAAETLPVILSGDLNSDASGVLAPPAGNPTPTYALIRDGGFQDPWFDLHPADKSLTCCYSGSLLGGTSADFYSRIDFTLYRGPFRPVSASIFGTDASEKTASGLWPSDHAGFASTLEYHVTAD
jgi:endonuclease/exonuclease/phosphatase family metal-dependent hydrolase